MNKALVALVCCVTHNRVSVMQGIDEKEHPGSANLPWVNKPCVSGDRIAIG